MGKISYNQPATGAELLSNALDDFIFSEADKLLSNLYGFKKNAPEQLSPINFLLASPRT